MDSLSQRSPASLAFLGSCLVLSTLVLRLLLYRHRRGQLIQKPIVSSLPVVPNAHWLFGHLPTFSRASNFRRGQHELHCAHANADGIVTFWFHTTPGCSVLLGRHVRSVLSATSMRKPVSIVKHHGSRFLGRKMLLLLTGSEWRYYRKVVHRAFTPVALGSYQRSIESVAEKLVASLSAAIAARHRSNLSPSGSSTSLEQLQQACADSDAESDSGSTELSDPASTTSKANDEVSSSEGCPSLTTKVLPLMKLVAMDIFAETSLSKDLGCCSSLTLTPVASAFDYLTGEYTRRVKDLMKPASLLYWLPTPSNYRHARERNVIRTFVTSTIAERRAAMLEEIEKVGSAAATEESSAAEPTSTANPADRIRSTRSGARNDGSKNLLTHLIRAVDEDPYDGGSSDEVLTDVLMTLLFAGYDTTSINLSYSLYLLSQHKEEREICLAEIDAVMDDAGRRADGRCHDEDGPVLDIEQLQYTKAVVLESLRLYPPAPMTSRSLERDLDIDGHVIPGKTHINIPIWSVHRDERNFPFPEHFLPKRWVERVVPDDSGKDSNGNIITWTDRTGARDRDRYVEQECTSPEDVPPANLDAFCAFSGGARSCPGRKIAVQESVTVLAYLLRNLSFEALDGYEINPIQASFVQRPEDDLPMNISLRRG